MLAPGALLAAEASTDDIRRYLMYIAAAQKKNVPAYAAHIT